MRLHALYFGSGYLLFGALFAVLEAERSRPHHRFYGPYFLWELKSFLLMLLALGASGIYALMLKGARPLAEGKTSCPAWSALCAALPTSLFLLSDPLGPLIFPLSMLVCIIMGVGRACIGVEKS